MDFKKRIESVGVVMRTFNNKRTGEAAYRLIDGIGVGKLYIPINVKKDNDGVTYKYLGDYVKHPKVQLLPMQEGYEWCTALNCGMTAFELDNAEMRRGGGKGRQFLWNYSPECQLEKCHVEKMLNYFAEDKMCAVVGSTFDGFQLLNNVKVPQGLGWSYDHPRNTNAVYNTALFGSSMPRFDTFCDPPEGKGMEDWYFLIMMAALTPFNFKQLDLRVPLALGENYNQPNKEKNEQEMLYRITERCRTLYPYSEMQRQRVEAAIATVPFPMRKAA